MTPPNVGRTIGPTSALDFAAASNDSEVATVQWGESSLSDVAKRLGMDKDSLQQVNPQISDPARLKVGQQVFLPVCQTAPPPVEDDALLRQPSSSFSQSGPPVLSKGDPLAKAMVQMQLAGGGPSITSPGAGGSTAVQFSSKTALASEQRLETLAKDPGEAHKAWKHLTDPERKEVLSKMEARYGKSFVQQFLEVAKKGKAQVETQNYQPGTGPSPDKLKSMGYHLGWKVIGNGAIENEFWVHPSGKTVQRDVSTWTSGSSQPGKTAQKDSVPDETAEPGDVDLVDPSSELEDKQEKAERVLNRLQDNISQIQNLLKSNPVPWDQVKQKFMQCNSLQGQLKALGASGDNPDANLDMGQVDENFYAERDTADQQLLDLRTKADDMNSNFEDLMQQPSVVEPDEPE